MPFHTRMLVVALFAVLSQAGCSTPTKEGAFADVGRSLEPHGIAALRWRTTTEEDRAADDAMRSLLKGELTADAAVQVALLNNPRLQAEYEDIAIAQADLVQAGLLKNPVFTGVMKFPIDGGLTALELGVAQDFLEVLFLPMNRRLAGRKLDAAKLRIAGAVLAQASRAREAHTRLVAAESAMMIRRQTLSATEASAEVARRIRAAGNTTEITLARYEADEAAAKSDAAAAELVLARLRTRLALVMGFDAWQASWRLPVSLPAMPESEPAEDAVRDRAVAASFLLAAMRSDMSAAGERLGIEKIAGWIQGLELGVAAERGTEPGWEVGPEISVPIPLFDRGQARIESSRAEIRRLEQTYRAAVSETRAAGDDALAAVAEARARAARFNEVIVPASDRITAETQRAYNAMVVGVLDLLRAKREELDDRRDAIDSLRDYWLARAALSAVLAGAPTAAPEASASTFEARSSTPSNIGGH